MDRITLVFHYICNEGREENNCFLQLMVNMPFKISHVFSTFLELSQAPFSKTTLPLFKIHVDFQHAVLYLNEEFQATVTLNYRQPPRGEEISVPPPQTRIIFSMGSLLLQPTNLWLASQQFPEVDAKAILIVKPNC